MRALLIFVATTVVAADTSAPRGAPPPARLVLNHVINAGDDFVFGAATTADARTIAAGRRDGKIALWRTGAEQKPLEGHDGYVHAVAFAPGGHRLASAGADGTVRLWDVATPRLERVLKGHEGPVHAIAFAPDGRRVVSGGADGARIWTIADSASAPLTHANVLAVASAAGRVATGAGDGTVKLWELATGKETRTLAAQPRAISAVALSPDGSRVATACLDGKVRVFGAESGKVLAEHDGFDGIASAIAYTPDGRVLVVGGTGGVKFYDAGRLAAELKAGATATGIAVAESGATVVATFADNRVRIFAARGRALAEPPVERAPGFLGVSYTNEGGALVSSIVAGSQAEALGLKANDLIIGVDGVEVNASDDFLNFMRGAKEGDEITLKIRRDGADKYVRAKLGRWH